jgi:hypothetical protein
MTNKQHANDNLTASQPANDNYNLADDVLRGAQEIADFLGKKANRRRVYHLKATSNLPTYKEGGMICARKSVLLAWIERQEEKSLRRTG